MTNQHHGVSPAHPHSPAPPQGSYQPPQGSYQQGQFPPHQAPGGNPHQQPHWPNQPPQNGQWPPQPPQGPGQPPQWPGYYPPKKSNKKIIAIIVAVVAVVAIGLLIFFLTRGGGADKESYRAGMEKMMSDSGFGKEQLVSQGTSEEAINSYFDCLADETYDDVSDKTRKQIADGKNIQDMSEDDVKVFSSGAETCAEELVSSLM